MIFLRPVRFCVGFDVTDFWNTDWLTASPMFAPLREAGGLLPDLGWPDTQVLDDIADNCGRRVVNANGVRVRFVAQDAKPRKREETFEPRAFLRGEVLVRRFSWHDLFNALVWMTFPVAKAALNARHYHALSRRTGANRTREESALTQFDEDGMIVLSSDAGLLDLVRGFRWKTLFWDRREEAKARMRFLVFGHALYDKARAPFVGMTGKALLFEVPERVLGAERAALCAESDRLTALRLWDAGALTDPRALAPLPVLGVPGWWAENESEAFYDNPVYFRAGRFRNRIQADSSE